MTTIYYPDVSNHQGEMPLQAGTVAVCAKASEGATYADPTFEHYQQEAARVGAVLFGYHFLRQGGGAAQGAWCFKLVGRGVNVMIDLEPVKDAAGNYISKPTVADAVAFAAAYRSAGGLCTLVYLPHWYWQELGSPDLAPLRNAGLSLVSSNYTTYSDTGPGWAAYGGSSPAVWQYTDALTYSGKAVDFNAFRGSIDQLKALLGYEGGDMPLTTADAQLVANTLLDMPIPRSGHDASGKALTGTTSLRAILAWSDATTLGTRAVVSALAAQVGKIPTSTATVDTATLEAALAALLPGITVSLKPTA